MRLLITGPGVQQRHIDDVRQLGFDVEWRAQPSREELFALAPTLTHYVLGGDERLDAAFMAQATGLVHISLVGGDAGAFIDVEAASAHAVRISTTPGITARAVAEHALALMLGASRGVFAHIHALQTGAKPPGPTREFSELTVGIVGLGQIGATLAHMLRSGFANRVVYYNRTRRHDLEAELGIDYLPLAELLGASDVLSLHAPAQPHGRAILGAELLALAKPGLTLINTASATLVDPLALHHAMTQDVVAAAAFDGYWVEPPPKTAADPFDLLKLGPRFVLTPHVAAKTTSVWPRMVEAAVANLCGPYR